MPLPTPNKGEKQNDFISRCISAVAGEFPDSKQRVAVCYSQWRHKEMAMKPDFDSWSSWKQIINRTANEVMTLAAQGEYKMDEAKTVAMMIENSSSWQHSLTTWSGPMWEHMRIQLSQHKINEKVCGHDPAKQLSQKPDRSQLMYGTIVKSPGLFGFELSEDQKSQEAIDKEFADELVKLGPDTEDGENPQ